MRRIDNKHCNCHGLVKQVTMGSHNRCDTTSCFEADKFDTSEEHQVCSNVADRIEGTKAPQRKSPPSVTLDAEKQHSNGLMDPGSLKVGDIEHVVVTCKDDDKNKKNGQQP